MKSSDLRKERQLRLEDAGMTNSETMMLALASALWFLAFILLLLIQPGLLLVIGVVLFCGWQYVGNSGPLK